MKSEITIIQMPSSKLCPTRHLTLTTLTPNNPQEYRIFHSSLFTLRSSLKQAPLTTLTPLTPKNTLSLHLEYHLKR